VPVAEDGVTKVVPHKLGVEHLAAGVVGDAFETVKDALDVVGRGLLVLQENGSDAGPHSGHGLRLKVIAELQV